MSILPAHSFADCSRLVRLTPLLALAVFGFSSVSCQSNKAAAGGQYAEYPGTGGADSGYRPYPANSTGYAQQPKTPAPSQYQEYTQTSPSASQPSYEEPVHHKSTVKKKSSTTAHHHDSYDEPSRKSSHVASSGRTHIVKHGDTLYGLAKRFHTTVSAIKRANGLSSDVIRDGTKLRIP